MQTLTQPTLLLKPFADEGDKNTLPIVNTDATQPQKADLTNGFPAITSLPPDQGGLPPERKDYNALGYLTTSYDWFYQCGGAFTFSQVVSDAIGGYPIGARLWYTDSSGTSMILRSTIENNTNNFLNDDTIIGQVGENKPWVIENFMGIKSQQPLLSFNWFDHEPNDGSWLRADTWAWQDGSIYKSAYQALADAQSTGIQSSETVGSYTIQFTRATNGWKIVSAANAGMVEDIYQESGVAWYYILDTANTQFKLPRTKYGFVGLRDSVGNYVPESLPNIKGTAAQQNNGENIDGSCLYTGERGTIMLGTNWGSGGRLSVDASRCSSAYQDNAPVQQRATQMYLYFYVGNTIQNQTEIDVGAITEALNKKWDSSNMQVVSELPENPQTGVFYFVK